MANRAICHQFDFALFLAHWAFTALVADAFCSADDRLAARAFPPFRPPLRPKSTAAGFCQTALPSLWPRPGEIDRVLCPLIEIARGRLGRFVGMHLDISGARIRRHSYAAGATINRPTTSFRATPTGSTRSSRPDDKLHVEPGICTSNGQNQCQGFSAPALAAVRQTPTCCQALTAVSRARW
jgi:hypothetical protein